MINLTPLAKEGAKTIDEEEYRRLTKIKSEGLWSTCHTETEWLAKLHYLRDGYKRGAIDKADFQEREKRLVYEWIMKFY